MDLLDLAGRNCIVVARRRRRPAIQDAAILGGWRCSAIKAIMMDGDNNPIRLRLFDEQNNRTKISIRLVPLSLQRDPTLSLSLSLSSSTLSREP